MVLKIINVVYVKSVILVSVYEQHTLKLDHLNYSYVSGKMSTANNTECLMGSFFNYLFIEKSRTNYVNATLC